MASAPSSHRLTSTERAARLAEMVVGLTGCDPAGAAEAVHRHAEGDDPLAVVAAAMVAVDRQRRAVLDDIEVGDGGDVDLTELDLRAHDRRDP